MLGWMFSGFFNLIYNMMQFLGLVHSRQALEQGTQVMVKAFNGKSVPILLRSGWTITDVKRYLSPELGINQEEIRIIFAGKELRDDVLVDSCDLGNQSILHAVKIVRREPLDETKNVIKETTTSPNDSGLDSSIELSPRNSEESPRSSTPRGGPTQGGDAPLNETLIDLQLIGAERLKAEAKKAHFYIWCNSPCKSLQAGKLRVRCSKCGEGAIVLYNDPCDWDDVLLPNRVSGCCETPGCSSPVPAEFYFKCAGHSGGKDDTAPALYLVKNNIKDVPCLACTEVNPLVVVFECSSRHVICVECFGDYARSRLGERQFVLDVDLGYTLPCAVGCPNSLVRETRHFKLLGEENYARYQTFGAEELVLQSGGVLCPQPGCGAGILPDLSGDCRRVGCQDCGFVFCRDCLQGAHIGACLPCGVTGAQGTSEGYKQVDPTDPRVARAQWTGADPSSVTIRVSTKPCPGCRTPTERDGGCMHMICTKAGCGLHWCWVCQVEWTRECMANHWFG